MANHIELNCKKRITPSSFVQDIQFWSNTFMDDWFNLEFSTHAGKSSCQVTFTDPDYMMTDIVLDVWMNSSRQLEFRYPHPTWAIWVMNTLVGFLSDMYDGIAIDEGDGIPHKPEWPVKYTSLKDWNIARARGYKNKLVRKAIERIYMGATPKVLRYL